jgi:hypothetical protein
MSATLAAINTRTVITRSVLFDIFGLAFIYFVPTLSHLLSVPLYLVEPMRIMMILAIAHTNKRNAYLIALTLPLFSFLVSAHPHLLKTMLITIELLANVWLFYFISNRWKNYFGAMLTSIVFSKALYYLMKYGLISLAFLDSSLISTPIYLQIITAVIFSSYLVVMLMRKDSEPPKFIDPTA